MRYIFYADVYFVQNFMMKVAVLYLTLYCNKMRERYSSIRGIGRICVASFIGTLIEIMGLLFSSSYSLFVIMVHLLEVPLLTCYVLGKEKKQKLLVIVTGYIFIIIINGILETLWNYFGEGGSYLFCLLFSCGAVIVGARIWINYTKMQKGIFMVKLLHMGQSEQTKGFYDSGNRVQDPYTGKGVHIVSYKLWEKIVGTQIAPVYVPYHALGNEKGMLEVYYIDQLIVEREKGRVIIQNCPVGVTKDNLFEGKSYEIILSEEVF